MRLSRGDKGAPFRREDHLLGNGRVGRRRIRKEKKKREKERISSRSASACMPVGISRDTVSISLPRSGAAAEGRSDCWRHRPIASTQVRSSTGARIFSSGVTIANELKPPVNASKKGALTRKVARRENFS